MLVPFKRARFGFLLSPKVPAIHSRVPPKNIRQRPPRSDIIGGSTKMFSRRTLDPVLAVALSFWMAAAACVIGCMQPVLANFPAQSEGSIGNSHSLNQTHTGPMPDMDCCHHEETPSDPAKDKKSHHQAVSCCPLDARVTPAQKWGPASTTAFKSEPVSTTELDFPFALFRHSFAIDHALWHSGRGTLLKTHVLRI